MNGPLPRATSELNEQMGESAKEAAHLRAELILTRHRVKELDERNTANRDTLVAKLEQWVLSGSRGVAWLRLGHGLLVYFFFARSFAVADSPEGATMPARKKAGGSEAGSCHAMLVRGAP